MEMHSIIDGLPRPSTLTLGLFLFLLLADLDVVVYLNVVICLILILETLLHGLLTLLYFHLFVFVKLVNHSILRSTVHAGLLLQQLLHKYLADECADGLSDPDSSFGRDADGADKAVILCELFKVVKGHEFL